MEEDEMDRQIGKIMNYVPLYGEFHIPHADTRYLNGNVEENVGFAMEVQGEKEAVEYLLQHGFMINRHDIKKKDKVYRQLTDKGRLLKECGSMAEYRLLLLRKEEESLSFANRQNMEAQRNMFLFWINVSISLSTGMAAIYYLLQLWDGGTQKHHCIVLSFLATSGVAILALGLSQVLKQKPQKE